jgi:pimeloyl-ACP methyl ester carboxylesterase
LFLEEIPMNAEVVSAPAIQYVRTPDGTRIAYRELGDGPAVLLVHGWPTSSFLFRNVMPTLAERNRVIAIDLPGFGESDKPVDARYDFDFFEGAIDAFLAAVGVDRVAVVGHDLGGPVVVHWAMRRPERVTRIGLLNTLLYPEFSDAVTEFVTELMTPEGAARLTSPAGLAEILRLGVSDPAVITDEIAAVVAAPFRGEQDRRTLARAGYGLGIRGFVEMSAELGSITCPVAVAYGTGDQVLPDVNETFERLQRDVPHAVVTRLPGLGHFVTEEAPDTVSAALASFVAVA